MNKQYIQWYDSESEAWETAVQMARLLIKGKDGYYVMISVEYYTGKWWIITVDPRS